MTCQIEEIFVYSHSGAIRRLPLHRGKLNIITGGAGTGKSSIVNIVDYCTGRSEFTIPEGVTRDAVSWYGVRLSFGRGTELLAIKPAPKGTAVDQSQGYLEVGQELEPPLFEDLSINANDEAIRNALNSELGITPNQYEPSTQSTRPATSASFKHTLYYLFQEQNLIANRDTLFYRQQEQFLPQTIRDTLPYLLGAVGDERLALVSELREARRELKLLAREQADREAASSGGLQVARELFAEARQVGLISEQVTVQDADIQGTLDRIQRTWRPVETPDEDSQLPELRAEINALRSQRRELGERIAAAEAFSEDASSYSHQVERQRARLQSIEAFPEILEDGVCPFCNGKHDSLSPSSAAVLTRLEKVRGKLREVEQRRPRLKEHVASLLTEKANLTRQIRERTKTLSALEAEHEASASLVHQNARAARVIGRISLFLESAATRAPVGNELVEQLSQARRRIQGLEEQLEELDTPEILTSYLNRIGADMTLMAERLTFENAKYPLRFDLNRLTVVADRPQRPMPMHRMGSAENWLGCHLVCLLALHRHFRAEGRPVPAFLVLDQPCQYYFPEYARSRYEELDGSHESTASLGGDEAAMSRVFELLQWVVEESKGDLQIIVLEHASVNTPAFKNALIEPAWSQNGIALVPPGWAASDV